ncbi:MAG: LuxR C-terminal-related transcriptional regulator [Treponema sp.]|nr:LuxR C-terminal-related transcriptional regulator [Treponema sp.]
MSEIIKQTDYDSKNGSFKSDFHFKRSRLNRTFMEAMKYPLILICAGAGYGKTTAVHDFVREYNATTVWVQLSERDNMCRRFWENFSHSMTLINTEFASSIKKLGFPDTIEKIKQFLDYIQIHDDKKRRIIVFDDCHFIENTAVIRFVEEAIRNLPIGITLFLISRSTPRINIAGHISSDQIFNVSEDELRFSENELAQYFRIQGVSLQPDNLRAIWQDTEGWAFALNYIVRSYKKAPGYEGYLRNAMKTNIFRFMEMEVWDNTSALLQNFLIRLSLIDHLSIELILLLAGNDKDLVDELEKQNAYVRCDSFINAYLIHPLFLEFLKTKQFLISNEEKNDTYLIAAQWCNKNGFFIDALTYYEKIGDYKSIVLMLIKLPPRIPYDIACYAAEIFDRTALEVFDSLYLLASKHLSAYMSQGLWKKTIELADYYEDKYLKLPIDNPFRKDTLATLYYCKALTSISLCLTEDVYDFDQYFKKLDQCYPNPIDPGILVKPCPGPWICAVGSSRKGALDDFYEAYKRSSVYLSRCFGGYETGEVDLAIGEIKFYQGDLLAAESFISRGLYCSRENKQPEVKHRALFYIMRIAGLQGNFSKLEQALKDIKENIYDIEYSNRFIDYDISLSWYFFLLGLPEKIPDWLKENISPYSYAGFTENYANQMKARYCYATRNYPPLLSYIHDMKQRESYLFGRIEMLVRESCIYYKLKEKEKALQTFEEAYNNAQPNGIIMPFVEMGKDMRTLTSFILKNPENKIPVSWLEDINLKSASYAKRITHIVTRYKQANRLTDDIIISTRESEVLTDLSHGLTRSEIAVSRNLSINTVKMLINNIYIKLGAENLADAIRIATERKIL